MYKLEQLSENFTNLLNSSVGLFYKDNSIKGYQKMFDFQITYLSPAYHFNQFEKVKIDLFEKHIKEILKKGNVDEYDMVFSCLKIQLELNALLTSIKISLDRLVFFISIKYKGVSQNSTFGRISEEGKGKGMMAEVIRLKENDELMKLIYDNYFLWIKEAVKPRDTIIHYDNLSISFRQENDNSFSPVFSKYEKKIDSFGSNELKNYIDNWYSFSNSLFKLLTEENN